MNENHPWQYPLYLDGSTGVLIYHRGAECEYLFFTTVLDRAQAAAQPFRAGAYNAGMK